MTDRGSATTIETEPVMGRLESLVFWLLTAFAFGAVGYLGLQWFTVPGWRDGFWLLAGLTVVLLPGLIKQLARWLLLPFMRRPRPLPPIIGARVAAVTTIVPGAESPKMLEHTLRAMLAMEIDHDVWVLDESNDPVVVDLCLRLGVHHYSRRGKARYQAESGPLQAGSKHGNYNAWLDELGYERYDFVAFFDPDHRPEEGFLAAALGYFRDPRVAWVQFPQAYGNQSSGLVARGAAEETYAYNSSVLMASYGLGFVTMIGSHNTHRVAALRAIGGLAPHEADDLLTALRYQEQGWKGVFVPEIHARGLTPESWSAYLNQQRRWARSVIDIKFHRFPHASRLFPQLARLLAFAHGLSYLYNGLGIPLLAILMTYMLAAGLAPRVLTPVMLGPWLLLSSSLAFIEAFRQRFYLDPSTESGLHWRSMLLQVAKWPYFLVALFDVLTGRRFGYTVTPKSEIAGLRGGWFLPHVALASATLAAALVGGLQGNFSEPMVYVFAAGLASSSIFVAASILTARLRSVPEGRRGAASRSLAG